MIRITGGRLRGRQIASPPGQDVRPTTGQVRESLFSIIGNRLYGATVLDLFAGSGIIGFEALSRGASSVIAVEKDARPARLLTENAQRLGLDASAFQAVKADVRQWLENTPPATPFDLVYIDPPYAMPNPQALVSLLFTRAWLAPNAWVILEYGTPELPVASGAECFDKRKYGMTSVFFYTSAPPDSL